MNYISPDDEKCRNCEARIDRIGLRSYCGFDLDPKTCTGANQ